MRIKKNLLRLGFLQSLSFTLYCGLVGVFFWKGDEIFGDVPSIIGPVAFLLLFSVSVLVSAIIVFYKPYKLFFGDKKDDALDLVLYTTAWLFVFFLLSLIIILIT